MSCTQPDMPGSTRARQGASWPDSEVWLVVTYTCLRHKGELHMLAAFDLVAAQAQC